MIGASPRKSTAGVFTGLGDLPGLQDVRADIPLPSLSIDLRYGSPLPVVSPEPLADTDDRKVLRLPASRLGQAIPQSLEFTRALGERLARTGQVKRKAGSDFQLTQAFHALDLVQEDRGNLKSLVQGIARGADELGEDAAESVGRNLVRRLGNSRLTAADRALIVDTVMEVALARPETADALGALLRGMGHILGGALGAVDLPLIDQALHKAACLSIDPVMNHPQAPPRRCHFEPLRGPMRVVMSLVRGPVRAPQHLQRLVGQLLVRVASHPIKQMTEDDLKRGAIVLEALRFSLGDVLHDPKTAEALIGAVALHISECHFNPKALGWALGRMLGAGEDPQRDAGHVVSLLGQRWLGERRIGYLVWGILGANLPVSLPASPAAGEGAAGDGKAVAAQADGAAQQPAPAGPSHGARTLQRLLDLGERLAPRHLGRVFYALALTAGEARHWGPQCPTVPSDVVGAVLQASRALGDAHAMALLAGMQSAMRRLLQGHPAFQAESARLHLSDAGWEAASHAMRGGLCLVDQPALALDHPGLSTRHRVELLDLALNFGAAQSKPLVADLTTRLLAEDADPALRVPGLGRLVVRAVEQLPRQHLPAIRARLDDYVLRLDQGAAQARAKGRTDEMALAMAEATEARRWLASVAQASAPTDGKRGARKSGGR